MITFYFKNLARVDDSLDPVAGHNDLPGVDEVQQVLQLNKTNVLKMGNH